MTHRPFLSLALSSVIALSTTARADEVTLASSKDNTMYEDPAGALSNGAGIGFFAGRTNRAPTLLRRGLVAFDIEGNVPSGSTITGVSLRLRVTKAKVGVDDVSLHRALANWGEGSSDAGDSRDGDGTAATLGDATWIHTFFPGSFWAGAGGDFVAGPSATTAVDNVGDYLWSSAGMVTDVQGWLDDAAQDFGWVVVGGEARDGSAKRFATREISDPAFRPELTIQFDPPGDAAFWANYGVGFPGTLGIPALTSSAAPVLGTDIQIDVGNSRGANAVSLYVLGLAPLDLPGSWGGRLLVLRLISGILVIPAAGAALPFTVPPDPALSGVSVYVQFLQQDPGAAKGISNTAGLELHFGS